MVKIWITKGLLEKSVSMAFRKYFWNFWEWRRRGDVWVDFGVALIFIGIFWDFSGKGKMAYSASRVYLLGARTIFHTAQLLACTMHSDVGLNPFVYCAVNLYCRCGWFT
jgi:hypothetical protein